MEGSASIETVGTCPNRWSYGVLGCREMVFGLWVVKGECGNLVEKGKKVGFWMTNPKMGLGLVWSKWFGRYGRKWGIGWNG